MNLIEDYLRAIGWLLPAAGRDDILAELRDLVLTRVEAREEELGRRLSDDEVEVVLREVGHPAVVAARYGSGPQHVVGPAVYPYWLLGVKAGLAVVVCVSAIGLLVRLGVGQYPWRAVPGAFGAAVQGAIFVVGVATLIAWLAERRYVRIDALDRWRVKDLRMLELASWDPTRWRAGAEALGAWGRGGDGRPRFDGVGRGFRPRAERVGHGLWRLAVGLALLFWWIGALHVVGSDAGDLRRIGLDTGSLASFDWAGLKAQVFLPVLVYALGLAAAGLAEVVRPAAVRLHGALELALSLGALALIGWLAYASPLAAHIHADSVVQWVAAVRDTFEDGPPFPVDGAITCALGAAALAEVGRGLHGLWLLALGSRLDAGFSPTAPAAAARSSSL